MQVSNPGYVVYTVQSMVAVSEGLDRVKDEEELEEKWWWMKQGGGG